MLCGLAAAGRALAADDLDIRLHLAWGGGQERQWRGRVIFSSGNLRDLQLLGVDADEPGSIQLLGQQVLIRQKRARDYDGLEVSVQAPLDAVIRMELLAVGELQARVIEIPLSELVEGYRSETLDDQGNRLVIRRAPADFVRLDLPQDHLIFLPGDVLRCTVHGYRLGVPADTSLRCRMELTSATSRASLWDFDQRQQANGNGSWPQPEAVAIDLPQEEGVYNLDISFSAHRRAPAFGTDRVVARRRMQLVVLANSSKPSATTEDRRLVMGIDPSQANWFQRVARLPQWSLLPGFRSDGPLGNIKAERVRLGDQTWTSLPVGGWQAYPLPVDEVGTLHELDLEFAGDVEQSFAISLVEPNAAGKVIPIGLDSGVIVAAAKDRGIAVKSPDVSRHQLMFWPKTKSPLLVITNLSDRQEAIYGRFDVYRRSLPTLPVAQSGSRKAIAYFERPLFPTAFGAAEAFDEESGRSLEDWQTFLDGDSPYDRICKVRRL